MNNEKEMGGEEVSMSGAGKKSGKPNMALIIIIIAVVLVAGYLYKNSGTFSGNTPDTASEQAPRSPYADQSFSSSTTITGDTCTMNVCSGDGKCTILSGKTGPNDSCKLDEKQSTPEAQALFYIVS